MKPRLRDASSRVDMDVHRMYTDYSGTKDDLIAEGLATEDMFPQGRKRVSSYIGPDIPCDEQWAIKQKKGGIYVLKRWHKAIQIPEPPPEWSPGKCKVETMQQATLMLDIVIKWMRGDFEKSAYGKRVHKFSDRDIQQTQALQCRLVNVIANGHVEHGESATVRRIK